MKTYMAKAGEIRRKWYVVDAGGKPLGRLASEVAAILRGKNKPIYTPHVDTGDYVIVINAEKVVLTGNKPDQKVYRRHSGWPGDERSKFKSMISKFPERVIELAVKGMLPHNSLGVQCLENSRFIEARSTITRHRNRKS